MLSAEESRSLSWIIKFVGTYAVLVVSQALLVNVFLAIPPPELVEFINILIAPSLFSGPLIYWSTRDSPDVKVGLFITAVEFHFNWFFLGVTYATIRLGYVLAGTVRAVLPFVILMSLITAGMLWKRQRPGRGWDAAVGRGGCSW
jgi:hypothetical protein